MLGQTSCDEWPLSRFEYVFARAGTHAQLRQTLARWVGFVERSRSTHLPLPVCADTRRSRQKIRTTKVAYTVHQQHQLTCARSVSLLAQGAAHDTMRMTRIPNCTFEKSRQRYVFQIRVPKAIRAAFDDRTTIRVALGRVPEAVARTRVDELRRTWTAAFEAARTRLRNVGVAPAVTMQLDADVARRAVATWRLIRYMQFRESLEMLRSADDLAWDTAIAEADRALSAARRALVRGTQTCATAALADIAARYRVKFGHTEATFKAFVEHINAEAVQLAQAWIAVLKGELPLDTLKPADDALLPLTQFFGTPASALLPAWHARLALIGKAARAKTLAKYAAITADLGAVLTAVPVEMLTPAHISALGAHWRDAANTSTTVVAKMTTLISLIKPIAPAAAALIQAQLPRTRLDRVRRLAFSSSQLVTLRGAIAESTRCTHDDMMLVDLMMLTGARLGELLQLRSEDVRPTEDGWVLTIGNGADVMVKTPESCRTLPLITRDFPALSRWLTARSGAEGRLFANAKPDKHGHFGGAESKRLNRVIRKLYPDRRLVLESVRNTVARALRCKEVEPRVRRALLGHADLDIHERHYDPAGLLTVEDFMPAAHALAEFAREVLDTATPLRAETCAAA